MNRWDGWMEYMFHVIYIYIYMHLCLICLIVYIFAYGWMEDMWVGGRLGRKGEESGAKGGERERFIPHRQFCVPKKANLELSFIPEVHPSNHWIAARAT